MTIHYGHPAHTRHDGGVDITISLTKAEADAIGPEAGLLIDWIDTALWALAILRTGQAVRGDQRAITKDDFHTVINNLDKKLIPRLDGIRDAAVVRHADLGGTYGDLAIAMDVARSTAQTRRDAIERRQPTTFQKWATAWTPAPERCAACGRAASPDDPIVTTATDDAVRVHRSHVTTPGDGYFGTPTDDGVTPYTTGTPVAGGYVIGQRVRITGVSGPLADRTDLIGRVGEVTAEARDGSINLRGLSGKPRNEEVFADILGFLVAELEPANGDTEPARD
ncbi:hypothetical protein [Streptomyces sp. NPDC051662]|uniref:hypothetical protein n=1 Tax=Streptomyces sp. NPDC051662 TaxID=3154750 RepID=UPI0034195CFD